MVFISKRTMFHCTLFRHVLYCDPTFALLLQGVTVVDELRFVT
jgi:hypothetical protein